MTTALLLGDPSPSLRWRAAIELEGLDPTADDPRRWRGEIAGSAAVRALLPDLVGATDPRWLGYALCRAAQLAYGGPEVAAAAERLFSLQQPDGQWRVVPTEAAPPKRGKGTTEKAASPYEPATWWTTQTVVPLRGLAATGFAIDPRTERGYDWLVGSRLLDGSWMAGPKEGFGTEGTAPLPEMQYRRLTRGAGCRSATTGAVAALSLHPGRRTSEAARLGVDHLLARETREEAAVGWELSRLVGLEPARGNITFHATHDPGFLLALAARCGVSADDRRVRDLVGWLDDLRGPFGLWQHHAHPQLSRWLTFDLEVSRRMLADGDWVGDEAPASFTPYRKGRRRS